MGKVTRSPARSAAVAVLSDKQIVTAVTISTLQSVALQQLDAIKRMERDSALRAILCGFTLHRIKATLDHGAWMPWLRANVKGAGQTQCNFYMRLAVVALEKTRATKPELLALPGDQAELALDTADATARAMMEKLAKFVGERSLNELLAAHDIKGKKKLGGATDDTGDIEPQPPITAEQLADSAREQLSAATELLRQLLLTENQCQYLSAEEIRATDQTLEGILSRWRAALKKTLKAS